ncbi:methyltransferase domain-containing protein [Bdellovibrio bacteriovorus]|uniref:methyltransferase domain-containing protein n=1 Tax=Bdellovibrio bacteriovorus TaxID=959 RepID=UPI0012FF45C7|nr:methyltransferase domain-containing protein [Bdellovibrio bacteriovorus]
MSFSKWEALMSWGEYYEKMKGMPPRPLLTRALELMPEDQVKIALDLGCGIGTDSMHLLQKGWRVTAVEKEPEGVSLLKSQLDVTVSSNLRIIQSSFEALDSLPVVNFVYASLSLPFCQQGSFPGFWKIVESSFSDNCFFAANFFGPEDDWVRPRGCTGHSEAEIRELLHDFEILYLHERKELGPTATSGDKFWHLYSVIAQRK